MVETATEKIQQEGAGENAKFSTADAEVGAVEEDTYEDEVYEDDVQTEQEAAGENAKISSGDTEVEEVEGDTEQAGTSDQHGMTCRASRSAMNTPAVVRNIRQARSEIQARLQEPASSS